MYAESNGEQTPELVVTKTVLEFAHGACAVRFAGQVADRGTVEWKAVALRDVVKHS